MLRGAMLCFTELYSAAGSFAPLRGAPLQGASLCFAELRSMELSSAARSLALLLGASLHFEEICPTSRSFTPLRCAELPNPNPKP
jgi:uncharacterized protein YjbI with pentapeptide repeats